MLQLASSKARVQERHLASLYLAEDLWEVNSRIVSKINPDFGFIANLFTGNGQSNGSDARVINRSGADVRWIYKKFKMQNMVQINDWGPYDYHRDFNLTYPIQLMTDLSTSVGRPDWFVLPDTKLGLRGNMEIFGSIFSTIYTYSSAS